VPRKNTGRSTFSIVGIGTSAGGLEALELFMQNVPVGSGMAFVVVQHVDPTHKGILPYRTLENMIDGVAVTFTDITASKTLVWKLRATQAGLENQSRNKTGSWRKHGEASQVEIKRKPGSTD
jgi:hypothetical protein